VRSMCAQNKTQIPAGTPRTLHRFTSKFLSAGLPADRRPHHCVTDGFLPVAAHRWYRPRSAARSSSSSCCCYRRRQPRPDVGAAPSQGSPTIPFFSSIARSWLVASVSSGSALLPDPLQAELLTGACRREETLPTRLSRSSRRRRPSPTWRGMMTRNCDLPCLCSSNACSVFA
jgi:hypothetical protein